MGVQLVLHLEAVRRVLGDVKQVTQWKYLGLPMIIGRSKEQVFGFIRERVRQKVQGWKGKLLNQAGKAVMIKSVAFSLPNYALSCYKISKKLGKEINSAIAGFWWGNSKGESRMHWMGWDRLTNKKREGGLGFRDILCTNEALLAKQVWRILTKPNLLLSKVLKAKYFEKRSLLDTRVSKQASWCWQSLMHARKLIEEGSFKRVGDGKTINIWNDKWIPFSCDGKVMSTKPQNCQIDTVDKLLSERCWNRSILEQLFSEEEVEMITRIPVSLRSKQDKLCWKSTDHGEYTVQSGYELAKKIKHRWEERNMEGETSSEGGKAKVWQKVWKLKVKNKLHHFLWKCLNQILPVNQLIYNRTKQGDPICRCCGDEFETVEHALLTCREAQKIWKAAPIQWDGLDDCRFNFWVWWEKLLRAAKRRDGEKHIQLTTYILWNIWKKRNQTVFNGERTDAVEVVQRAMEEWWEYSENNSTDEGGSSHETDERKKEIREESNVNRGISICIGVSIDQIKRRMGYCIIAKNEDGQIQLVWAAAERRQADQYMDEANAIKLAMMMAAGKGWKEISIHSTDKRLVQKLKEGDTRDGRCSTTLENIHYLKNLFHNCLFCIADSKTKYITRKLAQYAQGLKKVVKWEDSFPMWIQNEFTG